MNTAEMRWVVPCHDTDYALIRRGWNETPLRVGLTVLALYTVALKLPCAAGHTGNFAMAINDEIREEAIRLGLTIPANISTARWPYFNLHHIVVRASPRCGELQLQVEGEEGCGMHNAFKVVKEAAELLGIAGIDFS